MEIIETTYNEAGAVEWVTIRWNDESGSHYEIVSGSDIEAAEAAANEYDPAE